MHIEGGRTKRAVQGALLTCAYAVLDYAQTGLIAAVFGFKMMEWWYQSAEERMSAPTVYPPPPPPLPPLPPKVAKEGIPLPPDRTLCALCSQKRVNPSAITVSGFVFCYACIFKYVSQYNRCPVTLVPATVDQIRRLFHDLQRKLHDRYKREINGFGLQNSMDKVELLMIEREL